MAQRTSIEWTDVSWNPTHGCSHVSTGCKNCYAETLSLRYGQTKAPWTERNAAENVLLKPHKLREPLSKAGPWKNPCRVFVNSMSDLFHEQIPDEYIAQVFAVMALASQHTYQILSKRPERMRDLMVSGDFRRKVAALVYDARHGQGSGATAIGPVRGRRDGVRVADRAPSGDGAARGGASVAVPAASCGVPHQIGLFAGLRDDHGDQGRDGGAPSGLGSLQWSDPGGADDQSPQRDQDGQSPAEPGNSDEQRTASARAGRSQCAAASADGREASKDALGRRGCTRDAEETGRGPNGEGHRSGVRHEAKGRVGDLPAPDLDSYLTWPLPNCWLGVSIENRKWVGRADVLRQTPAAVRFISAEPLLGPLVYDSDMGTVRDGWPVDPDDDNLGVPEHLRGDTYEPCWEDGANLPELDLTDINWCIAGGESGPKARPLDLQRMCDLRDACAAAGTAYFVKQLGGARPGTALEDLPRDLRIREFPASARMTA